MRVPPWDQWKLDHRGGDLQNWAQINGVDTAWALDWSPTAASGAPDKPPVRQNVEAPSPSNCPLQNQGNGKAACEAAAYKNYAACLKAGQRDMGIIALGAGAGCGLLALLTEGAGASFCANASLGASSGFGIRATTMCYVKLQGDLARCDE